MEVHQLRYFMAVAEAGSFSRAAERLHVAQPSLSQQIQKLEGEVGQALFDRLPRKVTLTAAGQALLPHARRILTELSEAQRCLVDWGAEAAGEVKLGVIPTIAPFIAEQLLKTVARESPLIGLVLVEDVTENLGRAVDEGDVDMAILSTCRRAPGLHIEAIASEPLSLAVPEHHRLATRKSVSAADLRDKRILLLHESNCLTAQVRRYCKDHHIDVLDLRIMQLRTLYAFIAADRGLSLAPILSRADAQAHGCALVPIRGEAPERMINLLRSSTRSESKALRQIRTVATDLLKSAIADSLRPPSR